MRAIAAVRFSIIVVALGCGGGGDGGGGGVTTPPVVQTVTTVNVTLSSSTIEIGGTVTASATVLDQNSSPISGKTVTWTSDNEAVATVSAAGVVTGITNGTASITGTVEGKQGKATGSIITSTKWMLDATVLTNASYGGAVGSLADVAVVKLNDGRYRMWMGAIPGTATGIFSAISSDGIHFTPESGVRVPGSLTVSPGFTVRLSHPFVMRLDDGRLRLYAHSAPDFSGTMGMYSLTSTDEGVTFTVDPGARFTTAQAGLPNFVGSATVKMKSGGYRMYFSVSTPGTAGPDGVPTSFGADWIKSATSTDLLTWTYDAGIRVGPGSTITGSAGHPGAIANADGSVTLVYFRQTGGITYYSTSADGLSFTTEASTGLGGLNGPPPAIDPFLMQLPNGDVRMFYNWGDDKFGNIYVAHRRGFTLAGP